MSPSPELTKVVVKGKIKLLPLKSDGGDKQTICVIRRKIEEPDFYDLCEMSTFEEMLQIYDMEDYNSDTLEIVRVIMSNEDSENWQLHGVPGTIAEKLHNRLNCKCRHNDRIYWADYIPMSLFDNDSVTLDYPEEGIEIKLSL